MSSEPVPCTAAGSSTGGAIMGGMPVGRMMSPPWDRYFPTEAACRLAPTRALEKERPPDRMFLCPPTPAFAPQLGLPSPPSRPPQKKNGLPRPPPQRQCACRRGAGTAME